MAPLIRIASIESVPIIRGIALATWPVAYGDILSASQLTYMLDLMYSEAALSVQFGQGHVFLLGFEEDKAIGFASYETHHQGGPASRIHKLYVLPWHQRTGIGAALLNAITGSARTAGDRALCLNVNRHNRAKGFYLKKGFRIVRDEVIDIGHGYVMDDHVMELAIL
ncbi:MAG TPA: GNAT family N-acetyltransferase [Flavobacteriales bacterium]|nr:GNAT family N-acetyltransferase [Flavobacteriales bacterium]